MRCSAPKANGHGYPRIGAMSDNPVAATFRVAQRFVSWPSRSQACVAEGIASVVEQMPLPVASAQSAFSTSASESRVLTWPVFRFTSQSVRPVAHARSRWLPLPSHPGTDVEMSSLHGTLAAE